MLDVYMKFFGEEYRPHYIVDNNAKLWGTQKYGILICDPKMLAQSEQKIMWSLSVVHIMKR